MNIHLESIKIPEFKVIKNLELTFESKLIPRIYPVVGANGSGKSTMLELLFLLLHGAAKPELHQYIKNAIASIDRIEDKQLVFLTAELLTDKYGLIRISFYNSVRREIEGGFEEFRESYLKYNIYPVYFCPEQNYILWCGFDSDDYDIDFDGNTIVEILTEVSDRIIYASYAAQDFSGPVDLLDYYWQIQKLERISNYVNLDRINNPGIHPVEVVGHQITRAASKGNLIVLLDNIDLGLHPDGQYAIVGELERLERLANISGNQYIIATHSYELCTALTPAHVKEIR